MKYTAAIINAGHLVFSPILHCHPLAQHHALPGNYEFWRNYNHHMLRLCTEVWVIRVQGWEDSEGVRGEIAEAFAHNILTKHVKLDNGLIITPLEAPCLTSSASALAHLT